MEFKAYLEGIRGKWWLIVLLLILSFWIGNNIGRSQTSKYTETTSILLNSQLLANMTDPTGVVKFDLPPDAPAYQALVVNPVILNYINKHYPRLTKTDLQTNIAVTGDKVRLLLYISVSDISPNSAADIANYLAQQFVQTQNADLAKQLDYYQNFLKTQVSQLNDEINKLNLQIQQLEPPPGPSKNQVPLSPTAKQTINSDQYQLDSEERDLYKYQLAQQSLENTRPLFANAYVVIRAASGTGTPVSSPPSMTLFRLGGLLVGLIAALTLIIALEFFSPFIRHRGELERLVGMNALGELPQTYSFEQKRLLQLQPPLFSWRLAPARLASAQIGARATREIGHTVLLTSPRRKRNFAAVLATMLAHNGHQTLLIDANFAHPDPNGQIRQIKLTSPSDFVTSGGLPMSFIKRTAHPRLFVLPGSATIIQNVPMTATTLIELLPELQNIFGIIIIDAPPLDCADTHLLATRIREIVFLVKKRRDSLRTLKLATSLTQEQMQVNVQGLLLG